MHIAYISRSSTTFVRHDVVKFAVSEVANKAKTLDDIAEVDCSAEHTRDAAQPIVNCWSSYRKTGEI